ncbi:MAG TPA: cyclic nucleotide-binding domain-containing protein [Acidimicrobiales bacterium]|nr:cyclic nucleotide-binding domain-containing protein [Acidimicrobiales bacterium]
MSDLLALCRDLPVVDVGPGTILIREGDASGAVWILEQGALEVRKGTTPVNTIDQPGAIVGEMSALLGVPSGATVEAVTPSRLRRAPDGVAFLRDPAVLRLVAVSLAERLNFMTAYLADLKEQYVDAPGLSMVGTVLTRLSQQQHSPIQAGSARDPDPEY